MRRLRNGNIARRGVFFDNRCLNGWGGTPVCVAAFLGGKLLEECGKAAFAGGFLGGVRGGVCCVGGLGSGWSFLGTAFAQADLGKDHGNRQVVRLGGDAADQKRGIDRTDRYTGKVGKKAIVISLSIAKTRARKIEGERGNDAERVLRGDTKRRVGRRLGNVISPRNQTGIRLQIIKAKGVGLGITARKGNALSLHLRGSCQRQKIELRANGSVKQKLPGVLEAFGCGNALDNGNVPLLSLLIGEGIALVLERVAEFLLGRHVSRQAPRGAIRRRLVVPSVRQPEQDQTPRQRPCLRR